MSTAKVDRSAGESAHHFRDADHEFDTSKVGTWLFLCTEVLMFGGLFVAYFVFSNLYPETFLEGSKHLQWFWPFIMLNKTIIKNAPTCL